MAVGDDCGRRPLRGNKASRRVVTTQYALSQNPISLSQNPISLSQNPICPSALSVK